MALKNGFFFLLLASCTLHLALGSDPDILTDFVLPANANAVDGSFFTFTGLRSVVVGAPPPANFTVTKAALAEFPALDGQSVSMAVLAYPVGSVNPVHSHPRSAELLFLVQGNLAVGFVDTTNKLYTQWLQPGDMFVFPMGLVHFQYNCGQTPAMAISAFGSANAGTVSVPRSVFAAGIDDNILAKSFKTDVVTIQKLKAGLQG